MIFVTGATGLVGSFICRKLIQEGCRVKAMKRPSSKLLLLKDVAEKIEWEEADLLDVLSLNKALEGCTQIVHCAGMVSYHKKDADLIYKVNAEGTANLVNAALSQSIENFVHISSVAAIGRSEKLEEINESFKWSEADEHTAYGQSKHQAELEVFRGGMEGMAVVILNPALVLGPGPLDRSSTQVFRYVKEEKKFYTEGCMNYIDARDLATITYAALQGQLQTGERYIISAGTTTYKNFFEQVAYMMKKKAPFIRVNSYLLQLAYLIESFRSRLQGKKPLITRETLKLSQQRLKFSNSKIKQALDYQFIPLEETIRWTCQNIQN